MGKLIDPHSFEKDPLVPHIRNLLNGIHGKAPIAEGELPELSEEQKRRLPYVMAAMQLPCILCGSENTHAVNTWAIPDRLRAKGDESARTLYFCLCRQCLNSPNGGRDKRITERLLQVCEEKPLHNPLERRQ